MRIEEFEQLLASVREGGAIFRGEAKPSRIFDHAAITKDDPLAKEFAICVETDDPELLIPNKIYQVLALENNLVNVTDEAGEAVVYTAEYFLPISFPPEVEQILARVAER